FCDVFALGRNSVAVVIGDVANKGIAASLMTFSLLSMFRNVAKTHKSPCDILESINRSLIAQIKEDYWFATAFYGRLNTKLGTFTFSSAGQETPLWYHAESGEVEMLDAAGYPLGLFGSFNYETKEIMLKQGDRIVLYTDGITDAANALGERFGHERLTGLIKNFAGLTSKELTDKIVTEVEEFAGGVKQRDDIIVSILELEEDPWVHKKIVYGNSGNLINEILDSLGAYNLDSQIGFSIRLSLDEALANAWRHGVNLANEIEFEVSYLISDEGFQFRVKDPGKGFDHESLPDPTVEENLFKSHGRGVFLMRQLMDDVDFNDIGNEITVTKYFPPDETEESSLGDTLILKHMKELKDQQASLSKAKVAGETGIPADAIDRESPPGVTVQNSISEPDEA
ncbi:MAG: SpoIIE family protein phosphatase, partial [bacterium]